MSEEVQFVRVYFPTIRGWLTAYNVAADGVNVSVAASEKKARVFLHPSQPDLKALVEACGEAALEPASYAEWIEHGADCART